MGAGLIIGQPAWLQQKIQLRPQHRGVHLVTEEILRQVSWPEKYKTIRISSWTSSVYIRLARDWALALYSKAAMVRPLS